MQEVTVFRITQPTHLMVHILHLQQIGWWLQWWWWYCRIGAEAMAATKLGSLAYFANAGSVDLKFSCTLRSVWFLIQ